MSGAVVKFLLTAAFGAVCAVAAYIATRPVQAQGHQFGPGGGPRRRQRNPSPAPRNSWHCYADAEDSENEIFLDAAEAPRRRVQRNENPVVDSESVCTICLETFKALAINNTPIVSIKCGHVFCEPCLTRTLTHGPLKKCPTCRETIQKDDPRRLYF